MRSVMYIAINKDLDELMKEPGKIGAHTAHAIFDYMWTKYYELNNRYDSYGKYEELIDNFKFNGDTIVVVKASQKDMLKWEKEGYVAVRDRGLTCVEPDSLTAINLGIYDKDKGIPKWIQRLRLLKREDCI